MAIPILVILGLLTAIGNEIVVTEAGEQVQTTGGGRQNARPSVPQGDPHRGLPAVNRYRAAATPWRVTQSLGAGGAVRGS